MTHLKARGHTRSVDISFDKDIDATNAVQFNLLVFVISPIAHPGHVCSTGIVFLVAFGKDCVFIKTVRQFSAFVRFDPGIVVESAFDISVILVSVEPDVCKPN
jgi:hypothetical protein